MTPEQIALVQQSFARVRENGDALAVKFYEALFTADPTIRPLFSTEPAIQRQKFMDELEAIVWSISNLGEFMDRAMALGARHVDYGTTTGHYETVREALFAALHAELGDAMGPDVEEAWRVAYNLVAETMMMGAADPSRTSSG